MAIYGYVPELNIIFLPHFQLFAICVALLAACFGCAGLDWRDHVKPAPGFEAEYPRLVSDPSTINALGWRPRVPTDDLARMMVESAQNR